MFEIAIIGAGPAGASAGLFSAKAGKKTIVFDSDKGMTKRAWMENHYGVMEISGPDMVEIGRQQMAKFGAEIKDEEVTNITKAENGYTIETAAGTYEAQYVIFATGVAVDLAEKIGLEIGEGLEPRIQKRVIVDAQGKTSLDGVYAAGTVAGASLHTIITAGEGAKVAINIISEINGTRYVDHDVLKK